MTEHDFSTRISGGTNIAGTRPIGAPRALYAVISEPKPKKNPEVLLPPAAPHRLSGIRLTKSDDRRDQEQRRHHQPPGRIHLSRREICLKKRSHPCQAREGYVGPYVSAHRTINDGHSFRQGQSLALSSGRLTEYRAPMAIYRPPNRHL